MSQDNKKSFVMYQGDGSNNVFSVPMTKGKFGTISVAFVRRGLDQYEYNPATFTLNSDNTLLTWTGATLNVGDFIVIQRTTTREQPFEFLNNQKHLEKSDDNLERQIQEVADKVDNALLVDPTHVIDSSKMTPLQWMATILRSVDSSVRGFKIVDSILYYSADDPNLSEGSKTWTAVLNTINVTTIREHNNYLEYSVDGGITWKNISAISVAFENITGNTEDNVALKNALDAKQDLIPDLDSVRSGASKGETSVQPGDLATVATTGDIDDLINVEITDISDGQYLRYNAVLGKWQNVSSTASVGFDGITGSPEDNVALKNALDLKADVATTYTKTEVDTALLGKTNTDMDNLTDTGKNISNWSSNVSNCITNIPQDIKLELNNGTLTLKAGSKVYVPNGAGVFDEVVIENDIVYTYTYGAYKLGLYYNKNSNSLNSWLKDSETSGTTAPSGDGTFYNTTANKISRYVGGSITVDNLSFPIATITTNASQIISIDQVFNGFGFIGSTVFALPGVKASAPNSRNTDGSLKNIAFTVNNVITKTTSYDFNSQCALIMRDTGIDYVKQDFYLESETTPALKQYARLYQYTENQMYYGEASGWAKITAFNFGLMTLDSNGKITSFSTKTPLHAVDYSDTEFIAHQATPSGRYIDLTLGASGAVYTAPADGYVAIRVYFASAQSTNFVGIYHYEAGVDIMQSRPADSDVATFMPIKKGDKFRVYYNNITPNTSSYFRFVFAEGAK